MSIHYLAYNHPTVGAALDRAGQIVDSWGRRCEHRVADVRAGKGGG